MKMSSASYLSRAIKGYIDVSIGENQVREGQERMTEAAVLSIDVSQKVRRSRVSLGLYTQR